MNAVKQALYNKLTGGTALTALLAGTASVYDNIAPRGGTFDYVIFGLQGGGDENICPIRFKNFVWSVKGVSETSAQKAGQIDEQIDDLLHEQALTVTGWGVFGVTRIADFDYVETTPEGRNIWHDGGNYRIRMDENL